MIIVLLTIIAKFLIPILRGINRRKFRQCDTQWLLFLLCTRTERIVCQMFCGTPREYKFSSHLPSSFDFVVQLTTSGNFRSTEQQHKAYPIRVVTRTTLNYRQACIQKLLEP